MSDKIGDKIKELRQKQGLTQEELGELIGVKKAAINKYESGLVKNIKRNMQAKLAEALHTDPASLFYPDAASSGPSLPQDEELLLNRYRSLNKEGQSMAVKYIDFLLSQGYIKNHQDGVVDEEA